MSILEAVPASAIAGDTWRFTLSFPDYPAPTWDLTFYAENSFGTFNSAAVDSGSNHAFTFAAATTATLEAGRYKWRIRATDGTVVETISEGWLQVEVDPAAAGTKDVRGHARKVLDAIEATIEGRATSDQLAMSIAGRSISRMGVADLLLLRDRYRQEVRSEEATDAFGSGRQIRVRMVRV